MRSRLALAAGFLALVGLYYATSELLPNLSQLKDIVWVEFLFCGILFAPVYFALGLRNRTSAIALAFVCAALATILQLSGAQLWASIPN